MAAHYDVIVLGGGIIGSTSAYQLAKSGLKTLLIENRHLASGASGSSAAMLEMQVDAHRGEPFLSLSRASNDLFPSLYEEIKNLTGIDFQLERCGIYQLALSDEDREWLMNEVSRQKTLGLDARWVEPDDLQNELPQINPENMGAAFYAGDGQVNGEIFTSALATGARLAGAVIQEGMSEVALQITSGRVTGVKADDTVFTADHFVIATGSWTDTVLSPLGIQLGIKPIRGQLLIYDTPNRFSKAPVYTRRNGYVTPKSGFTLVGSTVEDVGFDEQPTESARLHLEKIARELMPNFTKKSIRGMSAGLRPYSQSGLPILGRLPSNENVVVASGHYRNGVLLSPITAKIVTAIIMKKNPPVDITPFKPQTQPAAV